MVQAKPVRGSILAGNDLLPGSKIFPATNEGRRIYWNAVGGAMDSGLVTIRISVNADELDRDLERIEDGRLGLPTVSAIAIEADGIFNEEIPVYQILADKVAEVEGPE